MNLGDWQTLLEKHFKHLRSVRSEKFGDKPIFALEHGLDEAELAALTSAIKQEIAHSSPSRNHSLPWIVYAAELGYRYSGDEYWQTFESETPGWSIRGDRYWIRACFGWFHNQFGGAKPTGSWAEHFSIICWPITHAILPRDLQRQLAWILYELRHSFSFELFQSPAILGERIAAKSWEASSRFQNLAQEKILIGQIAAALLLKGEVEGEKLLLPSTLARIEKDLDRERTAREWLRGARRLAQQRAQFRGVAPTGDVVSEPGGSARERARQEIETLALEPSLFLRPRDSSSWELFLEIPDLSPLLLRFPEFQHTLTSSRCTVAGSDGRPRPREFLLHGAQLVKLQRWPGTDEVLLQFEQSVPSLDYLLHTDCLLRPGRVRLFRIASDGLGYEIRGLRVRPGERYIVLDTEGTLPSSSRLTPATIACDGAKGAVLGLPSALDEDWTKLISQLGLDQAKSVEVWPAGLSAASWDGDGRAEWLASERACLAIRSDHDVKQLLLRLHSSDIESLELADLRAGQTVYVELPALAPGAYKLRIIVQDHVDDREQAGSLDVLVREPRAWTPGPNAHGPLAVVVEPPSPTLEELWDGKATVELNGPPDRQVGCTITLSETPDAGIVTRIPPLKLPVSTAAWRTHFETHFVRKSSVENAYDAARFCLIAFSAEELGAFVLKCEREFSALRWVMRSRAAERTLQLLDDSGSSRQPEIQRYSFEKPDVPQILDPVLLREPIRVGDEGGLYLARSGDITSSIVVAPRAKTLQELLCRPTFEAGARTVGKAIQLVKLIDDWANAKLTGNVLAATRRREVLLALTAQLFSILGGDRWAVAEMEFAEPEGVLPNLSRAVSSKGHKSGIAAAIVGQFPDLLSASPAERARKFSALARSYLQLSFSLAQNANGEPRKDYNYWLPELALRLASDPFNGSKWASRSLTNGVTQLFNNPELARAARFFVLTIERNAKRDNSKVKGFYPGWNWE